MPALVLASKLVQDGQLQEDRADDADREGSREMDGSKVRVKGLSQRDGGQYGEGTGCRV